MPNHKETKQGDLLFDLIFKQGDLLFAYFSVPYAF